MTDAPPVLAEGPPPALIVSPAAALHTPDTIVGLETQVAEVLRREGVPRVGLAIVNADGVTWAGGVGVADLASGRAVDEHTVFRVASIGQPAAGWRAAVGPVVRRVRLLCRCASSRGRSSPTKR